MMSNTTLHYAARPTEPPFGHLNPSDRREIVWREKADGLLSARLPLTLIKNVGEIVASFSLLSDKEYGFRCTFDVLLDSGERCSVPLVWVGEKEIDVEPLPQRSDGAYADVDILVLKEKVTNVCVEITLSGVGLIDLETSPWIFAVTQRSLADAQYDYAEKSADSASVHIPVPPISQMVVPEIGKRICSPTSVAMVLSYYAQSMIPASSVAARSYCKPHDIYGAWPWAIYAASRFHTLGYLRYFSAWAEVRELLEQEIPVIASIRYARGEITGIALERESEKPLGHLMVIVGYQGEYLLVNDSAAETDGLVARKYLAHELLRLWFERSGIGYVLIPPSKG